MVGGNLANVEVQHQVANAHALEFFYLFCHPLGSASQESVLHDFAGRRRLTRRRGRNAAGVVLDPGVQQVLPVTAKGCFSDG